MANLIKKVTFKQVGKSIIAVIDKQKHVITLANPVKRNKLKEELESFNLRPSETRLKRIIKGFTPLVEKKKTEAIVLKKKAHQEKKALKQDLSKTKRTDSVKKKTIEEIKKSFNALTKENTELKDKLAQMEKVAEANKKIQTPVQQGRGYGGEH